MRLKENPRPTEEELYMAAFKEWLEPQVRAAASEMFKKGGMQRNHRALMVKGMTYR